MTQAQEYDLKKSTEFIGPLYPILEAKDGDVLDGVHRFKADHNWPRLKLDHIDSEEKKIAARLVANLHRRQVSRLEKEDLINALAELYVKQGFKVEGSRDKAQGSNEVAERIVAATGLGRRTVMAYLRDEFKQNNFARKDPEQHPTQAKAADIIYNNLKNKDEENPGYAMRVIDRFKEEIKEELLKNPLFRKEVLDMLPKSALQPSRPALVFDPSKDEHVQELMRLNPENFFPETRQRSGAAHHGKIRRKGQEDPCEGYEPLGSLYKVFVEECPNCLCLKCSHVETCLERVRPED